MNIKAIMLSVFFCCSLFGCASREIKLNLEKPAPAPHPTRKLKPIVVDPSKTSITISIKQQKLFLLQNGILIRAYDISTSLNGAGNQSRSTQTPLGLHRIYKKIGQDEPIGMVFRWATPQNYIASIWKMPPTQDAPRFITTRILWLEGTEEGKNKGKGIDSKKRHIYIHGANQEGTIGSPDSKGCILMRNKDIVELFDVVQKGTIVNIESNK